jgi:hypothetical protein
MRKRNWWFFEITGQGHLLKRNRGIDQKTPITRLLRILKKGKNISQEIFISYVLRKHL